MAYCLRCHDGKQAPGACETCHRPTHVPRGACTKCHVPTHWRPSTFKHPKTGCATCHTPPHADRGECLRCHTTSSWASHFSHPIALGGVRASFPCERCHTNGLNAPGRACVTCHGTHHGSLTDFAKVYWSCHDGNVPSGD